MKIDENQQLASEPGDGFQLSFVESPNRQAGELIPRLLLVHASESSDVQSAVDHLTNPASGRSAHLVLGRDGRQVAQLLPFNVRAQQGEDELNGQALGIELDYPGPLSEEQGGEGLFNHVGNFTAGELLYAPALNEQDEVPTRLWAWPAYPMEQLEALARIGRLLVGQYGLQVVGHDELDPAKLDPGPAFPMLTFKDRVSGRVEPSLVTNETRQEVELRSGPGMVYPPRAGGRLPAGAPLSIRSDHDGWALVEVMGEAGGQAWTMGWVKRESIGARRARPVVKGHQLFSSDGRQYPLTRPHPNNYDPNGRISQHKYLIIHATGGINMESTIHAFRDEHHGASAHLLVGRDGSVVQFVDFDTVAYHCGYSYWEGDSGLNRLSIGIELDNAQFLKKSDGVWKWKTTILPEEEVVETTYWKNQGPLGWQRFTDVQVETAVEIAQALQEAYGVMIILGHDVINLKERVDPGPLFPMQDFRQRVRAQREAEGPGELGARRGAAGRSGRRQGGLKIRVHTASGNPAIYANRDQEPPDLEHPRLSGTLPAGTKINPKDIQGDWALVKVTAGGGAFKGTTGWMRSNAFNPAQANPKTTKDSKYYRVSAGAAGPLPPSELRESPLPQGTRLRIEQVVGEWALVAALETVKGNKALEGWVKHAEVTPKGVETLVYPPPSQI